MTQTRYHFLPSIELEKYFDVTWIIGHFKIPNDETYGQKVICLNNKNKYTNYIKGELSFVKDCLRHLKNNEYDLIYVHIHRFSFLYPILRPSKKYLLMMFTSAVSENKTQRIIRDFLDRKFQTFFYKDILLATDWMQKKFKVNPKKTHITGWGNTIISTKEKDFKKIRLLYIGTLTNRNIHIVIYGLKQFIDHFGQTNIDHFDIIGKGGEFDTNLVKEAIANTNLNKLITIHGYKSDIEIVHYFNICNVGISFVPITEYFNNVLATKTYEYLLSGMAVIATETIENAKVINRHNGVLIPDSAEGVCIGMKSLSDKLESFNYKEIISTTSGYSYEDFVKQKLEPLFSRIINNQVK